MPPGAVTVKIQIIDQNFGGGGAGRIISPNQGHFKGLRGTVDIEGICFGTCWWPGRYFHYHIDWWRLRQRTQVKTAPTLIAAGITEAHIGRAINYGGFQ